MVRDIAKRFGIAAIAAAAMCTGTASAGVLYESSFDDNDISDWFVGAAWRDYHTLEGADNALQKRIGTGTDNATRYFEIYPGAVDSSRVFYSVGGDNVISFKADMRANDNSSSHAAGEFGVMLYYSTDGINNAGRWDFRFHSGGGGNAGEIWIRTKHGSDAVNTLASTTQADAELGDAVINDNFHTYELRVTLGETSNLVELLVNDSVILSGNSAAVDFSHVSFTIWGGNNNDLSIDNVVFSTVPEPTALAFVGMAALGLLRRRHA